MLTNAAAKAAGARSRAWKLADQGGLFLLVRPTGTKSWQLKYRWHGREKLLTIGQFPALNCAQARHAQAEAKAKLADGVDPSAAAARLDTFEAVARAWHAKHRARWSAAHAGDVLAGLERDLFPGIGAKPIGAIGAAELVRLLEGLEARGLVVTAGRLRQRLRAIFGFARSNELVTANPAAELGDALAGRALATPHPALTTIDDCRALLAACEAAPGRPATKLAHRFLALTAVRFDALRGMRWGEVEGLDGPHAVWRVPAGRMKLSKEKKAEARFDHVVPLAPAAVAVLRDVANLHRGDADLHALVFAGRAANAPIGEGTLRELIARTPFAGRHVPHGWRASFSTIANEDLGEEWRTAIDRALAHSPKDKVEAAYNRAQLLARRRAVLERWAALLTD